jgi:alkaline phosphatase
MYQGKLGRQAYDLPGWEHYLASTFPLNTAHAPTHSNQQDPKLVYDPAKHWVGSPLAKAFQPADSAMKIYGFATAAATDSAAAATALATGVKSYNSAINWSDDDKSLRGQTIAELAKSQGKAVGVITTVPWSHATPAGLGGAHSVKRDDYVSMANEMLNGSWIDVLMGAGNPHFDDNNKPIAKKPSDKNWAFVGGEATRTL